MIWRHLLIFVWYELVIFNLQELLSSSLLNSFSYENASSHYLCIDNAGDAGTEIADGDYVIMNRKSDTYYRISVSEKYENPDKQSGYSGTIRVKTEFSCDCNTEGTIDGNEECNDGRCDCDTDAGYKGPTCSQCMEGYYDKDGITDNNNAKCVGMYFFQFIVRNFICIFFSDRTNLVWQN